MSQTVDEILQEYAADLTDTQHIKLRLRLSAAIDEIIGPESTANQFWQDQFDAGYNDAIRKQRKRKARFFGEDE